MYRFVNVGERKFKVIRTCNEQLTTEETKESIKQRNLLIDVVLSDGKGNLLFCHEMKEAKFKDYFGEEDPGKNQ